MRATRKQFIKRCTELSVTFVDNGYCLAIDTPKGKTFATYDTHSEVLFFNDGWTMPEIYGELIYVMKDGLIDCDDAECEICHDVIPLHSTINNYQHSPVSPA